MYYLLSVSFPIHLHKYSVSALPVSIETASLQFEKILTSHGSSARSDLKELWRRIVFSMAVSNTDDHLRNHGFLLTPNGWRLSPMFDVNPNPKGNFLSLNVTLYDSGIDPDLAVEAATWRLHFQYVLEMSTS